MLDIYICEDNTEQREFAAAYVTDYCNKRKLDAAVALASHAPIDILNHFNLDSRSDS